jgi:hypothetical protein
MQLPLEQLCVNDPGLQLRLVAVRESQSLSAIVIAAWQLGLAFATKVVEEELAVRALRPTQWSGCPKYGMHMSCFSSSTFTGLALYRSGLRDRSNNSSAFAAH